MGNEDFAADDYQKRSSHESCNQREELSFKLFDDMVDTKYLIELIKVLLYHISIPESDILFILLQPQSLLGFTSFPRFPEARITSTTTVPDPSSSHAISA